MKTKADLALDVLEQLADYYDVGHAKHLAVRCLDADGGLVGWHYNPARFALDLLGHVNQLDLASDPTVTDPESVRRSIEVVADNADVHEENGCGVVTVLAVTSGTVSSYERPASWDADVVDLRVECLRRIADNLMIEPEGAAYDELMDQVLGITNDEMWRMCCKLGLDRAPDLGALSDEDMDALVNEITATQL